MAALTGFTDWLGSLFSRRGYEAAAIAPRFRDPDGRWAEWRSSSYASAVPANLAVQSRHQYQNNGYWRNAVDSWTDAIAGAGFGIIPKTATLMTAWTAFAANAVWGGGTLDGLTVNIVRAMVRDGEGLAVLQPDGRWLQLPHSAIAGDYSADGSSRIVREGIELTDGQETACYIRRDQDTEMERLDRSRYVRVWRQDSPDQVRGVPWGASVLIAADTLASAEHAIAEGIKTSALLGVLLVNENDMGAAFPFEGDQRGSVMESGLEPGALKIVPGGYRPHIVTPQQSAQAGDFLKHELRRIAAGFGLPAHKVSGDLSDANYSSLRSGQISLNTRAEAAQYGLIVPQLLRPIWQHFVTRLYLAGEVTSMDEEAEFIAPRPGAVDPQKDVSATADMLKLGLISRRRAVAELGWDVEAIDQERASDQRREAALNLAEETNA